MSPPGPSPPPYPTAVHLVKHGMRREDPHERDDHLGNADEVTSEGNHVPSHDQLHEEHDDWNPEDYACQQRTELRPPEGQGDGREHADEEEGLSLELERWVEPQPLEGPHHVQERCDREADPQDAEALREGGVTRPRAFVVLSAHHSNRPESPVPSIKLKTTGQSTGSPGAHPPAAPLLSPCPQPCRVSCGEPADAALGTRWDRETEILSESKRATSLWACRRRCPTRSRNRRSS